MGPKKISFVRRIKTISGSMLWLLLALIAWSANSTSHYVFTKPLVLEAKFVEEQEFNLSNPDTILPSSTVPLRFPFRDRSEFEYDDPNQVHPFYLKPPANIKTEIVYDPETNQFIQIQKIGDRVVRRPVILSFEEYKNIDMEKTMQAYWREKARPQGSQKQDGLIPQIYVGGEVFDRIFGGSTIDIRPTGSAELIFGVLANKREDPFLDEKRQKQANFDFQQKIQLSVLAKIGDKIEINSNYNTEATFDFENKMKLQYQGKEDEIIKLIEAGDVTLPLPGMLITGSQSLFGFKTQLQFGNTTVTSVFSQQKTQTSTIEVQGGAQTSRFELKADQYEDNRHFLMGQHFYNTYDDALSRLPIINSGVNITKIEVWVTNIGAATTNNRNILALADLGESNPYNTTLGGHPSPLPNNNSNLLYGMLAQSPIRTISNINSYMSQQPNGFVSGVDYEIVENARLLNPNEYMFNGKLGFLSLNTTLNPDQVLAVAYQYTIIGDTTTYQVGEFSNGGIDAPNTLMVKLLKGTSVNTRLPLWKLMMKNVYNIGAFQVNRDDFRLDILYTSDELGVPIGFFSEGEIKGEPLIRVMGLDRLNTLLDPVPDGIFDFIDGAATQGGTIQSANGRIFFPVLEPFGSHLRKKFNDTQLANKYAFDSLYTSTKYRAQQFPEKNKFILEGMYKSAGGSDIALNAINVPQGSVKVTAGGITLTENVDYTVDYTLGRVKIINEAYLNSGSPIRISLESSSLFNIQTKTMVGTHINHRFSDNFNVGATIMNLRERPLTQKVNYGDEPISNTIWGLNTTWQTEVPLITRMLDWLPFYSTKTPSRITFTGEFAHLIPGHHRMIGKQGTAYIDDFEGSKSAIDLKNVGTWFLASTPQFQTSAEMFPEGGIGTGLAFGYNRSKLAWYVVDPLFVRNNNLTPTHIRNDKDQRSNHFVREILETELFPNKESANNLPTPMTVLNMAFYPSERGPYNYDVLPGQYSRGVGADGALLQPRTRWGGVMRALQNTDFEATNIEYIEFWMLDPFVYNPNHTGGDLYFNLGDISEDVLRDGRKSFENGLPVSSVVENVDTTIWGRVPTIQPVVNAFDNNPESRAFQDVGLDGLSDQDERTFFKETFLDAIEASFGGNSLAYQKAFEDPSSDNFRYFRGSNLDQEQVSILDRYKMFNGVERNSPTAEQSPEAYPTSGTTLPNSEDLNRDGTLNESERYFQYKVSLRPQDMIVGENFITDVIESTVSLANGNVETVKWYQFKIPLRTPEKKVVGNIQDFKSIRFMRMFYKNFEEPIFCRFATLELVRGTWRTYDQDLTVPGEYLPVDESRTSFEVFTVNFEENGVRSPVPYVIPPGIEREIDLGTTALQRRNEQSLSLRVFDLEDGDARAVYKTADLDMRQYKRLRMFTHAEAARDAEGLKDNDITVFIRLGNDFTSNYYEYEVPMKVTPWGTAASNVFGIWPAENDFDIEFTKLQELKLQRNTLARTPGSEVSFIKPFVRFDGKNKMTVVGTPTLSSVKVIMIGVRNPKRNFSTPQDDGAAKSAEVWVNELRLYEFEDQGGWAATGRINANLADLGNVVLAGLISTPGFGSIEKKVNDRQKETITSYDVATNIELGKLVPERAGLRIPMHLSVSESFATPQYNPLNPDIIFKDDLLTYQSELERDSVRQISQDYTRRKSLNFTNVSKTRTAPGAKTRVYDIENFNFTYAYTELFMRNIDIEYDMRKTYKGALGYNFSTNPKNVAPFSKVKFLNKQPLKIIGDFNFFYLPKMISLRTDMDRGYAESLLRNKSSGIVLLEPNYIKTFTWSRLYDVRYDITKSLKLEFNATGLARIDEPPGSIDRNEDDYKLKRDSIWQNIRNMGRMTNYNQRTRLTYNVPINKLPMMDWVTANAEYATDFDWRAAPLSATELGNTIENSNTKRLNLNGNLVNLYNKVDYLKKINQKGMARTQQRPAAGRPTPQPQKPDTAQTKESVDYFKVISEGFFRVLMGVRNVSFSYTEGNGTLLPGFTPSPKYLGQDWNLMAPGTGFVFGSQRDIREDAVRGGWLSNDPMLNTAYMNKFTENISARSTVEPFRDFKIEVTATRNAAWTYNEYFKADSLGVFESFSPMKTGSYSLSFFALGTSFDRTNNKTHTSSNYDQFKENLYEISMRLARENPNWDGSMNDSTGFPVGYGPTSQDVLIPAFIAAYSGQSAASATLGAFPKIPLPNWRMTYDGLSRIEFFKKYFRTVTLAHGYRSTYTIGGYRTDIRYRERDGFSSARDEISQNFIPENEIGQVSISEQFSPLINIDLNWQNSLMTRFEWRKSRDVSLSFANNWLTDVNSNEFVIGTGYRVKNLSLNIKQGGRTTRLESDLVLKFDLSARRNKTVLRKLMENVNQISSGQTIYSINFSADYQVSPKLNIRLFYDRILTDPFVSNIYKNSNTHAGFSLRFMLI